MKPRRVAITGLGLVTPVGNDVESSWRALQLGHSGGARIAQFDASGFTTQIAAEVKDFDVVAAIGDRRLAKFLSRAHGFAVAAADQALRDAGIAPTAADATRWGIAVGTGMMGVPYVDLAEVHAHSAAAGVLEPGLLIDDPSANDPMVFCRSQSSAGLSALARRYGIRGYASSVHTACASGGQAVGTAMKLIRRGDADCVLTGGFDSMVNPVGLAGFCLLSAVSADNDTPTRASRPFDATRNGFLLGEGAGFLVLEEWQAAKRRGAHIYAELAGDGNSLSSYRITDSPPDGDGPIQAMRQSLANAGMTIDDIDYINAHGTSTPMNDRSEAAAIKRVFGARCAAIGVSSTKSTMGHLIAAAGAVEAAVCALAIRDGVMPVNANLVSTDADCEHLDLIRDVPRRRHVRAALSNSFGFGGSNSCVVFRHPRETEALIAAGSH
jgi:3-oxoacyl-(acyl-carrier-protein) synthase